MAMTQRGEAQFENGKVHLDIPGISPLHVKEEKGDAVVVNFTISDEDKVVPVLDPSKIQSEGQNCEDNNSCVQDAEAQIALEDPSRKHLGACLAVFLCCFFFFGFLFSHQRCLPCPIITYLLATMFFNSKITGTDQQEIVELKKLESEAVGKPAVLDYVWRRGLPPPHSDHNVRIMRDQLMMARAFSSMEGIPRDSRIVRDLKYRHKENMKALEDVTYDSDLPRG